MVLSKLRETAEAKLGKTCKKAVVTYASFLPASMLQATH
jgi:molecular chaperone DnaK (HSP70)